MNAGDERAAGDDADDDSTLSFHWHRRRGALPVSIAALAIAVAALAVAIVR